MNYHSYNSVFYPSLSANNYFVLSVNQAFVTSPTFNESSLPDDRDATYGDLEELENYYSALAPSLNQNASLGRLQRLEKIDCIKAYADDYLRNRSNLLLVSPALPSMSEKPTILDVYQLHGELVDTQRTCDPDPYPWICPSVNEDCPLPCQYRLQEVLDNPDGWMPLGVPVDYCLSQETPESCSLMFNALAMAIVLVFNLLMVVVIGYVGLRLQGDPLITLGDAVVSFLANPDKTTTPQCLANRSEFKHQNWLTHQVGSGYPMARQWSGVGSRWYRAVKSRFIVFFSLL